MGFNAADPLLKLRRATLAYARSLHFLISLAALAAAAIVMAAVRVPLQWFWMVLFAAVTVPFSPFVPDPVQYFRGGLVSDISHSFKNFMVLGSSTFVSWIFAKSILNSSTLGATFGVVGGLAYAAWFVAFFSVAFVAYFMRTVHGYRSLPEAIHARYGGFAALAFGLAVAYRLEQEVWSNSLVVASFYGPVHSTPWWLAAIVSTAIPALYCFTGGMRASLLTDVFQAIIKVIFLVAVIAVVGSRAPSNLATFNPAGTCKLPAGSAALTSKPACVQLNPQPLNETGGLSCPDAAVSVFKPAACNFTAITSSDICSAAAGTWAAPSCTVSRQPPCAAAGGSWAPRSMWSLEGGMDMLIVGLLQGFLSYPFFDPVLTDRAFLGEPRLMVKSFVGGGVLAILFIFLFSFVGIFGAMEAILNPGSVPCDLYVGMIGGQPPAVARYFGPAVFQAINIIFLISSCSVLDSTFTSTSKLLGPELLGVLSRGRPLPPQMATQRHAWLGRAAIVFMAIVGTLPLLAGPSALDATTISGTMVVGLGPPVFALTFIKGYRPLLFHLPFWTGVAFAVVMQLSTSPCCAASLNVSGFKIGSGKYATLLGFNVVSTVVCWGLAAIALLDNWRGRRLEGTEAEEDLKVDVGDPGTKAGGSLMGLSAPRKGPNGAAGSGGNGGGSGAAEAAVAPDLDGGKDVGAPEPVTRAGAAAAPAAAHGLGGAQV